MLLQYPDPTVSLRPLPSLSNLTLAKWNPSSTQSSSCSSSVSLFCPTSFNHMPQLLDVQKHMPSQASQIYYQPIFKPIINLSKIWDSKSCFSFNIRQALSSIQNVLNSLQIDRCSSIFTTLLLHVTILTISTKFSSADSCVTPFIYTAAFFHLPIFECRDPYKCFPYLGHLTILGCTKGPVSKV